MRVSLIPIVGLALGCASVGVTPLGAPAPSKPQGCNLDVYTDPAKVGRPYREVCLIDAQTGSTLFTDRTMAAAIDQARPAACNCGGDAIVVAGGGTEGASLTGWGRGQAVLRVIVYGQ